MTTTPKPWMIRIGLGLAALLVLTILLVSIAPMVLARDKGPRLDVDPAALAQAPGTAGQPRTPTPQAVPATAAPAPQAISANDDGMTLRRVLRVDGPFRHGDYVWDVEGVPQGRVVITVDLEAQTIAVFRAGYQIGAAVIIYGANDKPTPHGTFHITQKKVDHVSTLYDAPMPYMMRLTDDGVAIHASSVAWGNATHGCIGVPLEFAKLLYAQADLGTQVIITSGRRMAVPEGTQVAATGVVS